jgi:hypothetical protein
MHIRNLHPTTALASVSSTSPIRNQWPYRKELSPTTLPRSGLVQLCIRLLPIAYR